METGAVSDEAAFLSERLRLNDISNERIRLAAELGHPAARLALATRSLTS
jgi:hypothetical protein